MPQRIRKNSLAVGADVSVVEVGLGVVLDTGAMSGIRSHAPGRVLLTRRRADTVYGGWWEFPGGKIEVGESVDDCVRRELLEEVGLEVEVVGPLLGLPSLCHRYDHATVRLHPRVCRVAPNSAPASNLAVAEHRWAARPELLSLRLLPANEPITERVAALLAGDRAQ